MRFRLVVFFALLLISASAFAKDVYLTIGGTVANFRTDARIFNPSADKDITIQAYFLPAGNSDNSAVTAKPVVVGKRQMLVLNDIVQSHFAVTGQLGAIRLSSPDDFVATQRIYAQESTGTLGQFVPGLDVTSARKKGVLIQMKSTGTKGTRGTFRSNVGFVNPNNVSANVTFRLYDKNNALVGQPKSLALPPQAVIAPSEVVAFMGVSGGDFSDAWLSFDSDQPIFGYVSVLDNGTEDPTFIPMSEDTGTTPVQQPPTPTGTVFTLRSGSITVAPALKNLQLNETITFTITNATTDGVAHGFQLNGPTGSILVPSLVLAPNRSEVRSVTLRDKGTYTYFCTVVNCTIPGHDAMIGTFNVEGETDPGRGY